MNHVVLLGDSIFDNASYVPGGPSVIEHLRRILPKDWRATLLAVDGDTTREVAAQLQSLPSDATHLIVSVGGNDALIHRGTLYAEMESPNEMTERLADVHEEFRRDYRRMLEGVYQHGKPTTVCTIYDAIPSLERGDAAALSLFNDVILREAFRIGAAVIDLRLVCNDAADYSAISPIEPSGIGGGKIARAVSRLLTTGDSHFGGSRVFA
jgi:GDSL-like Lipase/Acylhydrolase family